MTDENAHFTVNHKRSSESSVYISSSCDLGPGCE